LRPSFNLNTFVISKSTSARVMTSSTTSAALQLNNLGPMDNYLFGKDPDLDHSLFTYNVSRIAPFSKNIVSVDFTDTIDFGKILTATMPYKGDLINTIYLHIKLPKLDIPTGSTFVAWTNAIGYSIIEYIEILVGEFVISHQTGDLMEILDYMTTPDDKKLAKNSSVGRYDNVNVLPLNSIDQKDIYIPLQFWFNKKLSTSIPITALYHNQIKIRVKLRKFQECVSYDGTVEPDVKNIIECRLLADYYMISKEEKDNYINEELIYLVEQFQDVSFNIQSNSVANRHTLNIDKSIKELILVLRETESEENNDWFNYGLRNTNRPGQEFIKTIELYMNGLPRFEKINESYYRLITPQKNHTYAGNRNIYSIPFAEIPEINQPTGSVNFSLYSNVELALEYVQNVPECKLHVYGISYNILRIKDGKAKLEFLS